MDVTPAFRGTEAIASGRVTRGQLRGPGYLPLFRDVYVPAGQRLDLEARSRGWTVLHCGSEVTHQRADEFADTVARRLGLR